MSNPHFQNPQSKEEADPRRWMALFILLLANFMNLLDVTIVNVAIPTMQANFQATSSQIEWVVAGYVLAFALGLLPFGRLGDIVGRKMMFIIGVAGFTAGSALCGMAPSIEWLIFARVLQGLAGAVMTPQVLAIVQVTFPPQEKGLAFSLFGLTAGLASVLGPIIGGTLINANLWDLDWRPIFLINIPFGLIAIFAGQAILTKVPGHKGLTNDYVGIGIFAVAILLLIFPLIEGRTYDWPVWAWTMLAASFVVMAAFYLWQRRREQQGKTQLLSVSLLHNRNFLLGAFMTMIFFSGLPGLFMVLAIFFQQGFGFSALDSGLTTIPFPLGVLVASIIGGRMGSSHLRWRLASGSLVLVIGMIILRQVMSGVTETVDHWWFAVPLFISGIGLGIGISALFQTILAGIPPRDAGSGSGALQAFQQVGGSLGVALMGEIFFTWLTNAQAWGATSKGTAFAHAATNAMTYEIGVYVLVAVLVPFLKMAKTSPVAGQGAPAAPLIIEA